MEERCAEPDANSQEEGALAPAIGLLGLTPAWAALAGALSAGMAWDSAGALRLGAVILLVASLTNLPQVPNLREVRRAWLPYSTPASPSDRLARGWQHMARTWNASRPARLVGRLALLVLAGVLAVWLGRPALWASVALLALGGLNAGCGATWRGVGRWASAAGAVLIPWLLAASLLGAIGPVVLAGALLYTLTHVALLHGGRRARTAWPLALSGVSQLVVLGMLIVLQRPIASAAFALGLAAQLSIRAGSPDAIGLARLEPLVAAGMLLAAWTLGY